MKKIFVKKFSFCLLMAFCLVLLSSNISHKSDFGSSLSEQSLASEILINKGNHSGLSMLSNHFDLTNVAYAASSSSVSFSNPISRTTVSAVLNGIMDYLYTIAAYIALIFIVIGGGMYMLSAGNKDMMERGKKTLIYAIAGFAIVIAAPVFLKEILNVLGQGSVTVPSSVSGASGLKSIASAVLNLLLSIAGSLAIISIVIGAIWMFTAGGDKERYELGKKTVIYSIVGVTIVLSAIIVLNQVKTLIGG